MDERLNGRLIEVAQVGCRLAGLLTEHERLGVDEAESVDHDLALDGLNGVNNHSDSTGVELFETLLRVDIDRGEPAAETGMRMVPANDGLGSAKGNMSVASGESSWAEYPLTFPFA